MSTTAPTNGPPATDPWDANAPFWDLHMGPDGDSSWKLLQRPCLIHLARRQVTDTVVDLGTCHALDLATGNGIAAHWLLEEGCDVVIATDKSPAMLKRARERLSHLLAEEELEGSLTELDITARSEWVRFEEVSRSPAAQEVIN